MRFFHNSKDIANMKRGLNISRMTIPMLRAEHRFQIFVKLVNNTTIAMYVSSSDVVTQVERWFLHLLEPDQRGAHIMYGYLYYQNKQLEGGRTLSDYHIQKDCTIRQSFVLRGGGKRGHVIKTVVKSKAADKTTSSDSNLFASVFNHSEAVNRTTSVNFTNMLKTMQLNDLKSLYEYLTHDHSRKDMKLQKLTEWCTEIKELVTVQKKIHTAIDMMTTLITDNIQETFINSEGEFSMKELIRAVDNRIAVVSEESMTDI